MYESTTMMANVYWIGSPFGYHLLFAPVVASVVCTISNAMSGHRICIRDAFELYHKIQNNVNYRAIIQSTVWFGCLAHCTIENAQHFVIDFSVALATMAQTHIYIYSELLKMNCTSEMFISIRFSRVIIERAAKGRGKLLLLLLLLLLVWRYGWANNHVAQSRNGANSEFHLN